MYNHYTMLGRLDIKNTANILGVDAMTLRRWDKGGVFSARRNSPTSHRYYYEDDLEDFLSKNYKYLLAMARRWAFSKEATSNLLPRFYCEDSAVFKARLTKLGDILKKEVGLEESFSLITSVVGEIGNNSFDHNIGNWPDIMGIFFGFNLSEKKIILADRGQGVLTTLTKVAPELKNDKEALTVAFTKTLSGRPLEIRGNGLKYVKKIVEEFKMKLWFQSGGNIVIIDGNSDDLAIINAEQKIRGCFVIIDYKNL